MVLPELERVWAGVEQDIGPEGPGFVGGGLGPARQCEVSGSGTSSNTNKRAR